MTRRPLFLADSSVWIPVLRRRGSVMLRKRVDQLLESDQLGITEMVLLEVLGGAGDRGEFQHLRDHLGALHLLSSTAAAWEQAALLAFQLRRKGLSIPPTDILIAAVAQTHGATLIHADRQFDLIARHARLETESHVAAVRRGG